MMNYANVRVYNPTPAGPTNLAAGDNPGFSAPMCFSHTMWPHVPNTGPEVGTSTTGWTDTASPSQFLGEIMVFNAQTSSSSVIFQATYMFYARFRLIH